MTAIKQYVPAARNRVRDPSYDSAYGWTNTNGTLFGMVGDTVIFHTGPRCARQDRTATTPSNTIAGLAFTPTGSSPANACPVTIGETISGGAWIRCNVACRAQVNWSWRGPAGENLGNTTSGPLTDIATPNTWQRIVNVNAKVPNIAGLTYVYSVVNVQLPAGINSAGTEQTWVDDVMINDGAAIEPWFYGNSPGCSWTGTQYQSASSRAVVTPWAQWDGTKENPLDVSGLWNGSALQPVDLRDVTIV